MNSKTPHSYIQLRIRTTTVQMTRSLPWTPDAVVAISIDPQPRDPGKTGGQRLMSGQPTRPRPGKPVQPRDTGSYKAPYETEYVEFGGNPKPKPPPPSKPWPRDPGKGRHFAIGPQPRDDGKSGPWFACYGGKDDPQPRDGGKKGGKGKRRPEYCPGQPRDSGM